MNPLRTRSARSTISSMLFNEHHPRLGKQLTSVSKHASRSSPRRTTWMRRSKTSSGPPDRAMSGSSVQVHTLVLHVLALHRVLCAQQCPLSTRHDRVADTRHPTSLCVMKNKMHLRKLVAADRSSESTVAADRSSESDCV